MDDIVLIQFFLQGDENAFRTLMERYLQPIFNFVFSLVRDQALAEDIVQETFIKVWRALKKFDQHKSFKVWLYTIAKRTCWDVLRKKKTLPFSLVEEEVSAVADPSPLPSEVVHHQDEAKKLEEILMLLPLRSREILLLYYRENFNLREIAEILKESPNTVKSSYRRALDALKNRFGS